MGLVLNSVKFLVEAHKLGARFDASITLGRQHTTVSPERLCLLLKEYGLWPPPGNEQAFLSELRQARWRFEVFAKALGAKKVSSMDISAYEGADVVHDLSVPIGSDLHERFDMVIDGGTLEHVFHVPISMANCMNMTKVGGHVVVITNMNNLVGHGFYQFSPELFFRMFSRENGFEMVRMVAVEDTFGRSSIAGVKYDFPIQGDWYNVRDPDKVRKRNILITREPTVLYVLAKRVAKEPIFQKYPCQSEYGADDQSVLNPANQNKLGKAVIGSIVQHLPEKLWREWLPRAAVLIDPFRRWRHHRRNSLENRDFYERLP